MRAEIDRAAKARPRDRRGGLRLAPVRHRRPPRPRPPRPRDLPAPAPARPAAGAARRGAARAPMSAALTSATAPRSSTSSASRASRTTRGTSRPARTSRRSTAHARGACRERTGRTLELGCSIGVFTAMLAPRCEQPARGRLQPDRARARAARGSRAPATSSCAERTLPEEMPGGPVRPIVCSEVLYYWSPALVRDGLTRIEARPRARAAPCSPSTGAGRDPRRELDRRRRPRASSARDRGCGSAPRGAATPDYLLDRWVASRERRRDRDRRRRPAALAAAGAYREAGGDGAVTILAAELELALRTAAADQGVPARRVAAAATSPLEPAATGTASARSRSSSAPRSPSSTSRRARRATADGAALALRRCLLATGARPLVPDLPGADGPDVRSRCARVADAEQLARPGRATAVLVVGSGFIGCEAAASLALRGAEVTLATLEPAPQVERLGEEVAAADRAPGSRSSGVELARRSRAGGDRRRARRRRSPASRTAASATADAVVLALGHRPQRRARRGGRASRSTTACRSTPRWSRSTRGCSPPATSRSPTTPPPVAACGSSTGARRSTWARSPAGRWPARGELGRRARLLVDDRRAHAQVRRLGRRLRRGRASSRRRRGASPPATAATASWSACSPTSDDDAYEARPRADRGAGAVELSAAHALAPPRPPATARRGRRPGPRRGGADRRLPRRARRARSDVDPRRVRGDRRARRLRRRDRAAVAAAAERWPRAARCTSSHGPRPRRRAGARRPGMDVACARLESVGRRTGCSPRTDADSARRARLARARSSRRSPQGAEAIGGEVDARPAEAGALAGRRARRPRGRRCAERTPRAPPAAARPSTPTSPAPRSA